MEFKAKSWVWGLAWPWAHNNCTTVGQTIYYPKGRPPTGTVLAHETIHGEQQKRVGVVWYVLAYLLLLPVLWNPFRRDWETEAMVVSGHKTPDEARAELRSYRYGWLRW